MQYESYSLSKASFEGNQLWAAKDFRLDFESRKAEIDTGYVDLDYLHGKAGWVEVSLPTKDNTEYKGYEWKLKFYATSFRLVRMHSQYKKGTLFTYGFDFANLEQEMIPWVNPLEEKFV